MDFFSRNSSAAIIGLSLIVAVVCGGVFYLSGRTNNNDTLTVTGSARTPVTADRVIWRTSFSRNVEAGNLKIGYADMARDLVNVKKFLATENIAETEITITPITVNEDWQQNQNNPKRYTLRQNVEIASSNIAGITESAKRIDQVVATGVFFQSDAVDYYYTKLDEARISLLTDAISDAKARATAMAKSSNQTVGKLSTASSGVVQVLSRGSVDVSDYGSYDTSKIEKDIMVTVRATFRVK